MWDFGIFQSGDRLEFSLLLGQNDTDVGLPVLAGSRFFPISPVPVPTQTHKVSLFLQQDHRFISPLGLVETCNECNSFKWNWILVSPPPPTPFSPNCYLLALCLAI